MKNGKVYLIGAGPGDIELLTLKAVRALALADVVLLDDLVNREVLQFVDSQARIIEVGKRGGCVSTPQAFIEKQMVQLAMEGKTVARIKGGDPFIFGRGGEEMLTLRNAGIEVEVISGITSGIGAPATLGIPATHRDFSHGVSLVTGHTRNGTPPNWKALVESGTTLVIYMGMANLPEIIEQLIAAGMSTEMPAAAIQYGTLPEQNNVVSTLRELNEDVVRARLASPAIIVVGKVVSLAKADAVVEYARHVA